jgi:cation:H+ antiporter
MLSFAGFPLTVNIALFAVAAAVVWFAGSRLADYADRISQATGLGQAVVGIILLAGVTSLPEIAVTATASLAGNAELAVNNLFGSIALQVALLAIVDFVIGRRALTSVVPEPSVLLEGSLNVILLAVVAAAITVGDVAVLGAGVWSWACLFLYLACVWVLSNAEGKQPWLAAHKGRVQRDLIASSKPKDHDDARPNMASLYAKTGAVAVAILVAGFVLARSGEAIAEQTGLGLSFVGFVLIAFATSLPELSAALAVARRGLYTMAISDILGTNLINIALVFVADLLDPGEPVLSRVGQFSVMGAMLAIVVTALFQAGLAERRDRSVFRLGYDSILVVIAYVGGVFLLYTLRPDR